MNKKIKLLKHQASALVADMSELAQLGEAWQVKVWQARAAANERNVAAIIRDAGEDPALFSQVNIQPEVNGDFYLTLTPAPGAKE